MLEIVPGVNKRLTPTCLWKMSQSLTQRHLSGLVIKHPKLEVCKKPSLQTLAKGHTWYSLLLLDTNFKHLRTSLRNFIYQIVWQFEKLDTPVHTAFGKVTHPCERDNNIHISMFLQDLGLIRSHIIWHANKSSHPAMCCYWFFCVWKATSQMQRNLSLHGSTQCLHDLLSVTKPHTECRV